MLSMLVAIAGIGVGVYGRVEQGELSTLTRVELQRLANAVRHYHQDTGYWPRVGGVCVDKDKDESDKDKNIDCSWNNTPPFDWRVLFINQDDAGNSLAQWNAITQTGWRGPYIQDKLLSKTPIANGSGITAGGKKTNPDDDLKLSDPFRLNDLFAIHYADDNDPKKITTVVADQRAYALLALNKRNVIIAPGANGVHDSLPFCSGSDCKKDIYDDLCGLSSANDYLKEDDMVICP